MGGMHGSDMGGVGGHRGEGERERREVCVGEIGKNVSEEGKGEEKGKGGMCGYNVKCEN